MAIPGWMDKWFTPQTLVVIIGFIIWLVQLNISVVSLTDGIARVDASLREHEIQNAQTIQLINKTVYMLETLERRLNSLDGRVTGHEKDAAEWKHRIIKLETKNGD